ncbi:type IV pilus twitching motility protein PilT [Mucisphaera calidilacus]|uniref:Type II/IV secretion system protein n=1 Tax=Mucisphaera calidilacus TaxID=2527982 RepID=A0A518BXE3_9BACT|nr:type IV pilus twitching motility protein PilT [Mucisphaera calidilacus]QDU71653.1 Type II/IV secretion system protein [Mucisphaera calidilacus]
MSTIQIDRLLDTVVKQGASDLHLTVGKAPTVRMRGRLIELKTKILDAGDTTALMKAIAPERSQNELQEEGGSDFGFAYGDAARFRVSIFKQKSNVSLVLRQIPNKLLDIETIGLPKLVPELVTRPRGLFLVTGPTGSGKTTSLASMINHVNLTTDRHIITIEDPIEYYHEHKKSVVNQREVGADVPSFAEALRRALRQDPDVILVGEMRDLETIEAAITAAETGHLVFGTLHTTGASGTINRIIDAFPVSQQAQIRVQLSTALMAVVSQQLLPRVDIKGMVAAYEFMVVTPGIANIMREGKTFRLDSEIQTGKKWGMQLLDDHLWELYQRGWIDPAEMLDKAKNPSELQEKLHRAGVKIGRTEVDDAEPADSDGKS